MQVQGEGKVVPGSMFLQEVFKIELSKVQFPAFAGLELDEQESLLIQKKIAHNKMKYLIWQL